MYSVLYHQYLGTLHGDKLLTSYMKYACMCLSYTVIPNRTRCCGSCILLNILNSVFKFCANLIDLCSGRFAVRDVSVCQLSVTLSFYTFDQCSAALHRKGWQKIGSLRCFVRPNCSKVFWQMLVLNHVLYFRFWSHFNILLRGYFKVKYKIEGLDKR